MHYKHCFRQSHEKDYSCIKDRATEDSYRRAALTLVFSADNTAYTITASESPTFKDSLF